jgi:pyruvate formate lyase activating enzyme
MPKMPDKQITHPALLQRDLGPSQRQRVRCMTCERRCVISPGETGWCRTRRNQDGKLVVLTYGLVSSLSANPIEKKPLFHFRPGSVAMTAGCYSCNFACPWCQNWGISKHLPEGGGVFFSPEGFVAEAINSHCQGTSISLNEPTLSLEWSLDVFRLARQAGLYNTFVTNGYMTVKALELLVASGLDAMNVDVKGSDTVVSTHCQADVETVWRNLRRAQELGVWVEVTTLIVPGINDDIEMLANIAGRIVRELGAYTPWHLTRYHPAYQFDAPPTPVSTLEQARSVGREIGLRFVYVGNVPGHFGENTYCPQCGRMLVQRWGASLAANHVRDGRCPDCAHEIAGIGWDWRRAR